MLNERNELTNMLSACVKEVCPRPPLLVEDERNNVDGCLY